MVVLTKQIFMQLPTASDCVVLRYFKLAWYFKKFFIFLAILIISLHYMSGNFISSFHYKTKVILASNGNSIIETLVTPKSVDILLWSSYFNKKYGTAAFEQRIAGLVQNIECREWCKLTGNRSFLNHADAIVWHSWPGDINLSDMPKQRSPLQPWVWWASECPFYSSDKLNRLNGIFNWTMTYRFDSDVVYNIGSAIPAYSENASVDHAMSNNIKLDSKHPLAVAVISKCNTYGKRETIIEALQTAGLHMDIYGKCGKKIENDTEFWQNISKQYKFYLAFENSDCLDYITEKLWRTFRLGLIPVVYGGGNYTRVAPPHSFINVKDYQSANALVHYFKFLNSNPTEYQKYFQWKAHFLIADSNINGNAFCGLCEKLTAKRHLNTVSVYNNLSKWWTTGIAKNSNACLIPENNWFWDELKAFSN